MDANIYCSGRFGGKKIKSLTSQEESGVCFHNILYPNLALSFESNNGAALCTNKERYYCKLKP